MSPPGIGRTSNFKATAVTYQENSQIHIFVRHQGSCQSQFQLTTRCCEAVSYLGVVWFDASGWKHFQIVHSTSNKMLQHFFNVSYSIRELRYFSMIIVNYSNPLQ